MTFTTIVKYHTSLHDAKTQNGLNLKRPHPRDRILEKLKWLPHNEKTMKGGHGSQNLYDLMSH